MACVDENAAVALLEGKLAAADSAELLAHAAECDTCRQLVAELAKAATLTSPPGPGMNPGPSIFGAPPPIDRATRRRGDAIDRYVVLGQIGEGGMGVIYLAYDPDLDRRVALKFLREPSDRQRLLREAQAVAKLSHPNVVSIYDVGTAGDELWVAMEYVEGATLREWLAGTRRTWQSIIDRFLDAGRGLAAAHAAGIVHRDFKPENVLVAADGRARVLDFGLATYDSTSRPDGGTPRYMAPEQLAGVESGPAADQYSFCVALYEALYGRHPLDGAPRESRVPARIAKLLARGLARDPANRYPSLDALLGALTQTKQRKRTVGALAVTGLAVGMLAGSIGRFTETDVEKPCTGAHDKLAGVWDAQRKTSAHARFLATRLPYAAFAWTQTERALDQYTNDWVAMHTETCKATNVRREQSAAAMDLRMSCLARRLHDVKAATEMFAQSDRKTVEKATEITSSLPPLAECADVEALAAVTPPLRDPVSATVLDEANRELARARALLYVAKLDESIAAGNAALARARSIHYESAVADALYVIGMAHDMRRASKLAEPLLEEAFLAAESVGYDHGASRAAARLADVLRAGLGKPGDGMRWAKLAVAIAKRRGASDLDRATAAVAEGMSLGSTAAQLEPALERFRVAAELRQRAHAAAPEMSEIHDAIGTMLVRLGKTEEGIEEHRKALAFAEAAFGPDHPAVAERLMSLGSAYGRAAQADAALAASRRALAIAERALGPDSAFCGEAHFHIGILLATRSDAAGASAEYRRALAIFERTGASELERAQVRTNLGRALTSLERFDEAMRELEAALPVIEHAVGRDHPEVARVLNAQGDALRGQGKYDAALVALRRSLAIQQRRQGPQHFTVATVRAYLARVLASQGKVAEAEHELLQSLAIRRRVLGPDHPETAGTLVSLGEVHLEQKRFTPAVDELSRALAVLTVSQTDPRLHGEVRFLLARALWGEHKDRARAIEVARRARADFGTASPSDARRVEAWLAARTSSSARRRPASLRP